MDVCRVCLDPDPAEDILDIQVKNCNNSTKSFVEIVLFCLGIKVEDDSKVTTKICKECYDKTITFNEFKVQALNNDSYLKSNSSNIIQDEDKNYCIKLEEFAMINDANHEENTDSNCDNLIFDIKDEVNTENELIDGSSDHEFLSIIAKFKTESDEENKKTNGRPQRKRGRPKKLNSDITTVSKEEKRKKGRPKKLTSDITIKQKTHAEAKMCETCGKIFKNIKAHLEVHKPRTPVSCPVCDKQFSTKIYRNKHIKRKHIGMKKQCGICKKMVFCLKSHHLTMHDRESMPFQCVSCGLKFLSQSKLNEHMYIHTKDRPYQCDVCEKRFRLKITLVNHVRSIHNREKLHLCQFCSKSFFKKYHLQIHLRSHTKEKPYECKECGKFFRSTCTLRNHQQIHGDAKMFSCDLCDMTFVKLSYLKAHMISHLKEKRYPCSYCDAKFHRSDHRKRHERTAHQRHLALGDQAQ